MNRRKFLSAGGRLIARTGAIPAAAQKEVEHLKKGRFMVEDTYVQHTSIHRVQADGATVFYR